MGTNTIAYTEADEVATEFLVQIIYSAMERFSINFEEVKSALKKINCWEIFNEAEIACVGARDGVEPVLKEIEEVLK